MPGAEANNGHDGPMDHRNVLIAVDDSEASVRATQWAIEHFARPGDEFHFFHVIPVPMPEVVGGYGGLGGVDDLITIDPDPRVDQKHVEDANNFIQSKFVPLMEANQIPFKVEIVRFLTDNDSIGEVVCKRAAALNAAVVVMASHNKGALKEFFIGSVTKYCTHHCPQPVLVLH